jgi:hypothetical protein
MYTIHKLVGLGMIGQSQFRFVARHLFSKYKAMEYSGVHNTCTFSLL